MSHTSSPSSPTDPPLFQKKSRNKSDLIVAITTALIIFGIIGIFIWVVPDSSERPITEDGTCASLEIRMGFYQDKRIEDPSGEGIDYPPLENSQLVRKVYQGDEDLGVCTIRMRQPSGEENLYTFVRSRNGPITLSTPEGEEYEVDGSECEGDPPTNPNCNVFWTLQSSLLLS